MRTLVALLVTALLAAPAVAQEATAPPGMGPWSFSATAMAYFIPEDSNFVVPVVAADRDRLHLEARYNYEGQGAYSVWAGYNQSAGEVVQFQASWMLGGVFGDTEGVAPGCKISVVYERLDFYTEGEYLFDTNDSSGNFFYFWSELAYSPTEWFRGGLVSQRTRTYDSELSVQRGILIGVSHKRWTLTTYVLDFGLSDPAIVVSLGAEF